VSRWALSDGVLASYCAMFKFVRGWRSSVARGGDEDLRGQSTASASSRKVGAGSAHCPPPWARLEHDSQPFCTSPLLTSTRVLVIVEGDTIPGCTPRTLSLSQCVEIRASYTSLVYIHSCLHIQVYTYILVGCLYVCLYVRVCIHMCVCVYIYTHTHMYMYTYRYRYMYYYYYSLTLSDWCATICTCYLVLFTALGIQAILVPASDLEFVPFATREFFANF